MEADGLKLWRPQIIGLPKAPCARAYLPVLEAYCGGSTTSDDGSILSDLICRSLRSYGSIVHMHVCMYIYMFFYTCMYVCMYVCVKK